MGAEAQLKASNRELRKAFGVQACETIESLHKTQLQMEKGLDELERKERILDKRTRELRGDVNVQAQTMALFVKMTFLERVTWLVFGTFVTPAEPPLETVTYVAAPATPPVVD